MLYNVIYARLWKGGDTIEKYYIYYHRKKVFALCYAVHKKIYYNLNFEGKVRLYLLIW